MISIIIPTLNEESVLATTLQNLKQISSLPYEIIVSDGKSTDGTLEIVKKYGAKLVHHEGTGRQTIGEAKNLGAKSAVYKYLLFLDADVIIPEPNDFFSQVVRIFDNDSGLAGLTVSLKVLPGLETFSDRVIFKIANGVHFFLNNILRLGSASGEFQMARKDCFDKIGGFDASLAVAEDLDMFRRLTRVGRTRMIWGLKVLHTGRRAHRVGWPRLLWSWLSNGFMVLVFKKSALKEWRPIR